MLLKNYNLKNWISSNLFTKTHNLNNRICIDSWWINRNLIQKKNEIIDLTNYLPVTSSITERVYHIYHGYTSIKKCYCGNDVTFLNFKSGYRNYCSLSCSHQSEERNEKIKKNSNVQKMLETSKKTNQAKYGKDYFFQTSQFKAKANETKISLYKDQNYNNTDKRKETCLERYGKEHSAQVQDVITKIQATKSKKYPQLRDSEWLKKENKTKSITQIADEMNVAYRTVYLWFKKHNVVPNFFSSDFGKEQQELQDFVTSLNVEVQINDRNVISPKELDIYLPEHNVAIEYNGIYWHSEDKKRHLTKYNLCKEKNIHLIQIWDVEWKTKKDIVKSIIKNKLGMSQKIHARKCKIVSIDSSIAKKFLDDNHIQGNVNSSVRLGLMFENELVSVMTFGKSRFDKKYTHELLRFCNKLNTNVVGSFSKLLKHALNTVDMKTIQTFCDIRIFDGTVYEKNGFSFERQSTPGYFYYKSGLIKSRYEFQKHKLIDLLPVFDPTMSESDNCAANGWLRCWDCGQKVFSYTRK